MCLSWIFVIIPLVNLLFAACYSGRNNSATCNVISALDTNGEGSTPYDVFQSTLVSTLSMVVTLDSAAYSWSWWPPVDWTLLCEDSPRIMLNLGRIRWGLEHIFPTDQSDIFVLRDVDWQWKNQYIILYTNYILQISQCGLRSLYIMESHASCSFMYCAIGFFGSRLICSNLFVIYFFLCIILNAIGLSYLSYTGSCL